MKPNRFPEGWDEERVRQIIDHYENQTEDEATAEDEAAYDDRTQALIEVPVDLVAAVREMIAKHTAAGRH
jgi:hypothetical protein